MYYKLYKMDDDEESIIDESDYTFYTDTFTEFMKMLVQLEGRIIKSLLRENGEEIFKK